MVGATLRTSRVLITWGSWAEPVGLIRVKGEVHPLSIAVAAGIALVLLAIIAIPVIISVVGSAGSRNQNRAENEEDRARKER